MVGSLPEGFTGLGAVEDFMNTNVTVMGVITDYLPAAKTRGTHWQMTLTIQNEESYGPRQRVKLFAKEHEFPPVKNLGDIIILRCVKLRDWNGSKVLLSNDNTKWTVFSVLNIPKEQPEGTLDIPYSSSAGGEIPAQNQMQYAITLASSRSNFDNTAVATSNGNASGYDPKCQDELVENIVDHRFYNLLGQVIKSYQDTGLLTIYITDFTNNKLLYNYSSEQDTSWRGPLGQFTLAVTLFDPHGAYFKEKIKTNDYVELKHVHVKYGRGVSRLEGVIHEDRKFPTRIDVRKIILDKDTIDDRTKSLLRRKRDFIQNFGDWTKSQGTKRAAEEPVAPKSKASLKRERQNQRKREKKAEEQAKEVNKQAEDVVDANGVPVSRREVRMKREMLNENVACLHDDLPSRTLSWILDRSKNHIFRTAGGEELILPWQNRRRRADIRVVDFFPADIRDFAVREKVEDVDILDTLDDDGDASANANKQITQRPPGADEDDDDDCSNVSLDGDPSAQDEPELHATEGSQQSQSSTSRGYRYAWRFALLVEDRISGRGSDTPCMVLNVGGDDASYLLGVEPCDLYKKKNSKILAEVREKLWTLWGDLEERRQQTTEVPQDDSDAADWLKKRLAEKPSSRPFKCCIEEYAVRLPGNTPYYERRFSLFGTRIK